MSSKDFALLTANTRRNPSPVRIYWSLIALKTFDSQINLDLITLSVIEWSVGHRIPVLFLSCSVQNVKKTGLAIDYYLLSIRVLNSGVVFVNKTMIQLTDQTID